MLVTGYLNSTAEFHRYKLICACYIHINYKYYEYKNNIYIISYIIIITLFVSNKLVHDQVVKIMLQND